MLRGLKPESEKLDNLARDFQDILDTGKLKVCSLQESLGKTGLPIFNGKVSTDTRYTLLKMGKVSSTNYIPHTLYPPVAGSVMY